MQHNKQVSLAEGALSIESVIRNVDEASEKSIAVKMKGKGYEYIITFPGGKPAPLYAKTQKQAVSVIKDNGGKGRAVLIDVYLFAALDDSIDALVLDEEDLGESPLGKIKQFLRGKRYIATKDVNLKRVAAGSVSGSLAINISKGDEILVTASSGNVVDFTHNGAKARMPKASILRSFELIKESATGSSGLVYTQP